MRRRLQGIQRLRGAVKDVAGLAETGGDWRAARGGAGGAGGAGAVAGQGRAGPGGTCSCDGNVENVSEKLQMFRSKERARRAFVVQERGGLGKDGGGVWAKDAFCAKKLIFAGKENCIIITPGNNML